MQGNRATRIMMVKNNMWRNNMTALGEAAASADKVAIHWINKKSHSNAGSWFTDRSKAFGGVSRDLMSTAILFI